MEDPSCYRVQLSPQSLANSSLTFKDGADTLHVGLKKYTDGVAQLDDGSKKLKDGLSTLNNGASALAVFL